jgi:hypothetical protein
MQPLLQNKTLKVYYLLRQDGLSLGAAAISEPGPLSGSLGFFISREAAEMSRTHQLLLLPAGSKAQFHIFPLTLPNPAYKD